MKLPPGVFRREGKKGASYQVRWRDIKGQQRAKSFDKLSMAVKFNAKVRADRYAGIIGPSGLTTTFNDLADSWLLSVQHHAVSTAMRRDGILSNYLRPAFGVTKLEHIDCLSIDKVVKTWRDSGLKPHTVRNQIQILNQIFAYAVKKGMISTNPVTAADRPKLPTKDVRVLSEQEFCRLISAVDQHYRLFIATAVVTGFRFSELAALTVADLGDGVLHVRSGKTEYAKRSVPISAKLEAQIRATFPDTAPAGLLIFRTPAGHEIHQSNFRNRVFTPAVEAAELGALTFHDLRRTRATMLVRAGTDPKTTQVLMGHSSIETTLRFYVSSSQEGAVKAADVGQTFIDGASL